MKQALFIGAIASVLTLNNAMATGENIIASKSYVDAQDATKQDLIPSKNVTTTISETSMSVPSVVLYPANGQNAGSIGETGFVSKDIADAKMNELIETYTLGSSNNIYSDYSEWLLVEARKGGVGEYAVSGATLAEAMGILHAMKSEPMVCAGWPDGTTLYDSTHTDENCWLWYKN